MRILKGLACMAALAALDAGRAEASGPQHADERIAIIDTAWDTRPFLDALKARGVRVVGRYYARCDQMAMGLTEKRLIDQGPPQDPESEVAQLLDAGFAILSIYQFHNNAPAKFQGRNRAGAPLPDGSCQPGSEPRDARAEARLDADAAVAQARRVKQPPGSAIYFGVDFALSPSDNETQARLVAYFQGVEEILSAAGYRTGAYGSGLALEVLREARTSDGRSPLIAYAWLSASRAFPGTSAMHRTGAWDLFQNQVNREWFGQPRGGQACSRGLPVDTNVQNAARHGGIGAWTADGVFALDVARTRAIMDARRFACDGNAILRRTAASAQGDAVSPQVCAYGRVQSLPPRIDFANSARIGAVQGRMIQVDVDDDGRFDGWTWRGNLTADFRDKPDWIFRKTARLRQTCR